MRTRLRKLVLLIALATTIAGLASCRKTDTTTTPTPAAQSTPNRLVIPAAGGETSPLPSPGTELSPVQP